jgi:hypothetical protein
MLSESLEMVHLRIWNQHIHHLAGEIGPRGSTRDGERRASAYCARVLTGLGFKPQTEPFVSATSGYLTHLTVGLLMLTAFIVYPLGGRVSAIVGALIAVLALAFESLELGFRPNPLRWLLPKGDSQNVVATIPPAAEHRQDLVLIGHVDTNHASLTFTSIGWVDFWRITAPLVFLSFAFEVVLYVLGAVFGWVWVWQASIISAVGALILIAVCVQAELSPFSPGANDNATGVGLVLALAEHFQAEPLAHTRVWLACTGCEEVKHYGAIDFFERHQAEMLNPKSLVFEMLGRDGPAWLEQEVIVPPFAYNADSEMVAILKQLAADHPEWNAHPTRVFGGHSEMADSLRVGIPAVTLIGIGPGGTPLGYSGPALFWHHIDDTPDKIDQRALERAYALTWAFIRSLDNMRVES